MKKNELFCEKCFEIHKENEHSSLYKDSKRVKE